MADITNRNKGPEFNNVNERKGMNEEFQKEENAQSPSTNNELSTGNSIRNYGEVNGTTFGAESNTAKFSTTGQKNRTRQGTGDENIEDVNKADRQKGSGGTMYSDYLNKEQNDFISGTGDFNKSTDESSGTRPFDAMQGNRENDSER